MQRAAQLASVLLAVFLVGISMLYLFNPTGAAAANEMNPETTFGITNMRVGAAPMLMIGILAGIGAMRQNWLFLVPAALYFLLVALIRVFGLVVDGGDSGTVRGLALAVVLFVVAEFAVQVFKRAERPSGES